MKQLVDRFWWLVPVCVLLAAAVIAGSVLLTNPDAVRSEAPEPGPAALVDCASESPADFDCWRDRLQLLVAQDSPGAALADVEAAYDQVPFVSGNCHQLVHEIGRAAGHRYGDVAQAYAEGNDFCWSGYFHGVMEAIAEQLGVDTLLAQVEEICDGVMGDRPYGSDHYNCVHGLGHGLMAVTQVELYDALAGCDGFTDSWERESCYGGVFMENVMSRINPHHETHYLRDDDPLYPCTEVDDVYKGQCYLMQTSHALNVLGHDFAAVFALCESVEEPYRATCLQSLGRDISGYTVSDVGRTVELCTLGRTGFAQENCFIGAAKDYVSYFANDAEALALCAAIEDAETSQTCADIVVAQYRGR